MKKITSTLLFLAFSFLSFAQTAFTEKTVNEMNQRLVKDPTAVFKNEVSPNYTLIGDNGKIFTYQDVLALFEQNNFANEYSELKVSQHGNFGIATGISNHSFINKSSGKTIASYKVRFTYLHEFVNGKWQVLSGQHSPIQADATSDTTAIKKVCMAETQAFLDHDYDAWASYHIQNADEQLVYSTPNNSFGTHSGWENISKSVKDWTKGPKPENTKAWWGNWTFALHGDMAFVAYDASVPTGEDKISRFRESSTLLRVNGEWKILAVQAFVDYSKGK